jgi:hypothetical protein
MEFLHLHEELLVKIFLSLDVKSLVSVELVRPTLPANRDLRRVLTSVLEDLQKSVHSADD